MSPEFLIASLHHYDTADTESTLTTLIYRDYVFPLQHSVGLKNNLFLAATNHQN